jgi:NADH-quinone oxidoreductase subunit F
MHRLHKDFMIFDVADKEYVNLKEYRQRGGYSALAKVLNNAQETSIEEIKASGLRGRGGAAFPTGQKIQMVHNSNADQGYIICNADEGEPGTFKDRYIMTHLPFQLIEGITIAAYLAGATKGYIYVRHEYDEPQEALRASLREAEAEGLLGKNIMGSDYSLTLEVFSGAGSYLCGEETALLSSIEGRKGRPRLKPPYPTEAGLWGKPTLIHNVETLTNLPKILTKGAQWFRSIGTADSHGTKLISLSGDVCWRGLVEVPFGTTFREIIEFYGGGIKDGKALKAVNIGGASGVLVPGELLDTPLEYEACAQAGITIGSGAVFVLDETRSIIENVQNRVHFFLHESCGKCTPCREGLRQSNLILNKLAVGQGQLKDIGNLERYTHAMQDASFCGLGQAAGNSIKSSLMYYRKAYEECCCDLAAAQKKENAS